MVGAASLLRLGLLRDVGGPAQIVGRCDTEVWNLLTGRSLAVDEDRVQVVEDQEGRRGRNPEHAITLLTSTNPTLN